MITLKPSLDLNSEIANTYSMSEIIIHVLTGRISHTIATYDSAIKKLPDRQAQTVSVNELSNNNNLNRAPKARAIFKRYLIIDNHFPISVKSAIERTYSQKHMAPREYFCVRCKFLRNLPSDAVQIQP